MARREDVGIAKDRRLEAWLPLACLTVLQSVFKSYNSHKVERQPSECEQVHYILPAISLSLLMPIPLYKRTGSKHC